MRSLIASGIAALGLLGATVLVLAAGPASPANVASSTAIVPTAVVVAPLDGKALFQRKGCIACHSVSALGLRSLASFAPELSALPQVAGTRRPGLSAEAYVRESIRQPRAFRVPGFTDIEMPTLPLTDQELDTLVDFLLTRS